MQHILRPGTCLQLHNVPLPGIGRNAGHSEERLILSGSVTRTLESWIAADLGEASGPTADHENAGPFHLVTCSSPEGYDSELSLHSAKLDDTEIVHNKHSDVTESTGRTTMRFIHGAFTHCETLFH